MKALPAPSCVWGSEKTAPKQASLVRVALVCTQRWHHVGMKSRDATPAEHAVLAAMKERSMQRMAEGYRRVTKEGRANPGPFGTLREWQEWREHLGSLGTQSAGAVDDLALADTVIGRLLAEAGRAESRR